MSRRRADLRQALRHGNVRAAARAWSRLRVGGASLTAEELAAARAARVQMGRALRTARGRRGAEDTAAAVGPSSTGTPAVPARSRALIIGSAIAAVGLATVFVSRVALLSSVEVSPDVAPTSPAATVEPQGGRGRTVATPVPVATRASAAVEASPSSAVTATVAPSIAVAISPAPSAALPATPSAAPTAAPVTAPPSVAVVATPPTALLPPPLASGQSRIRVLVFDALSQKPIAGACIGIGATDCGPTRPHTNALGLWWFDFATGSIAGQQFAVLIKADGYQTLAATLTTTGGDQDFPAALQPIR
jgi:hypothetical protein